MKIAHWPFFFLLCFFLKAFATLSEAQELRKYLIDQGFKSFIEHTNIVPRIADQENADIKELVRQEIALFIATHSVPESFKSEIERQGTSLAQVIIAYQRTSKL